MVDNIKCKNIKIWKFYKLQDKLQHKRNNKTLKLIKMRYKKRKGESWFFDSYIHNIQRKEKSYRLPFKNNNCLFRINTSLSPIDLTTNILYHFNWKEIQKIGISFMLENAPNKLIKYILI